MPPELRDPQAGHGRQITFSVGTPLEEVERRMITETLKFTRGDKRLAADLLGIATRTIYRKLESGAQPAEPRRASSRRATRSSTSGERWKPSSSSTSGSSRRWASASPLRSPPRRSPPGSAPRTSTRPRPTRPRRPAPTPTAPRKRKRTRRTSRSSTRG
ncbi:helix-turn-helix domain-containing protein [Nannocystis pusilla]|uniref:helix-turn-helix domain-containing protein n=1 Tax=Nannocystis pusilla TaxID=889268 RepID=UPI003B81055A